jgi:hypothetical protein
MDGITLNGNTLYTDSFNSKDPNLSNDRNYDPTRTSTNGDIATMYGVIDVGNADVHGTVLLGPSATGDLPGPNGTISGGVSQDFNFEFPEVVLPATSWLPQTPNTETVDGVSYQYVFKNSGDYVLTTAPSSIYIGTNANVRIRITNNASPNVIRIAGDGTGEDGKLAIYMEGSTFTLNGNAVVDSGVARNFAYYGTAQNTSINIGGNATFVGSIYAPSADLRMIGGGTTPIDFVGALVARTANLSGHYRFHFDEDLMAPPLYRGYVATSWDEL